MRLVRSMNMIGVLFTKYPIFGKAQMQLLLSHGQFSQNDVNNLNISVVKFTSSFHGELKN